LAQERIDSSYFDSTIEALREGVTRVALRRAVVEVEAWQRRLESTGSPELAPVAENLGALSKELKADPIDGAAVAALLNTLGNQVGRLASGDYPPPISDRLQELADLLKSGADTLVNR
jgi:hypothetical protein